MPSLEGGDLTTAVSTGEGFYEAWLPDHSENVFRFMSNPGGDLKHRVDHAYAMLGGGYGVGYMGIYVRSLSTEVVTEYELNIDGGVYEIGRVEEK
jgi:hypothetical protein